LLWKEPIAIFLAFALTLPAQEAAGQASSLMAQKKDTLKINILQGEGAKNSIRARTAVAPAVEVRDANDKPVAGAEVVFQLPLAGPGGVFHGWLRNQTIRTDEKGVAATTGYTPNTEAGRFNIKVTATSGAETGGAVIAQANVEGAGTSAAGKSNWWKWALIAGGVGVGIGVAAAVGGDDEVVQTNPIRVSAGAVTVGGPR